jgi:pimeloyl-ACP methyl ester carboxylesterase
LVGRPTTRFTQAGDVEIGYQVLGDGPVDLVWITGIGSNIEVVWEEPSWAALLRRLGEFSRVIMFDRRGCGVSDRGSGLVTPTLEERMEDVVAVLDAVGSEEAALFGFSEGGNLAALFAATHPERTTSVTLCGTVARFRRDDAHPWGWRDEDGFNAFVEGMARQWGVRETAPRAVALWAPSMLGDERFADWIARFARQSISRGHIAPLMRAHADYDLVDVFPAVHVPALVLHRRDDAITPVDHGRWIAERLPDGRLVELSGADHYPFIGDTDEVIAEMEGFLVGPRTRRPDDRRLLTLVHAEVVDAARASTPMGDRAWHELRATYEVEVEDHLIRFRGRPLDHLAGSYLAAFAGPARAVRYAAAIVEAAARLGLAARAGVHCGECAIVGDSVQGVAVRVGRHLGELADPGEVLVSGTVHDLVAGSGLRFGPGRDVELRGLTGRRRVLALITDGATPDDVRRMAGERANLLRRDGEYWTMAYGGKVVTLGDTKGLGDLARLLAAPGREFHALDLVTDQRPAGGTSSRSTSAEHGPHLDRGGGEPVIDEAARRAYRRRLTELEAVLDDAQARNDDAAATRARAEHEALIEQLGAAYGLGGRVRRTPDHAERARKTISRRLRTSVRRIEAAHPALGRHLHASLRTGVFCSYQPERPLTWIVEAG